MTGDMTAVIAPRSDQMNAEDLLSGPVTIKITSVDVRNSKEQPVTVHYEGENGKPFKPCKTVCKIMARVWKSEESKTYVGKSMTLFRDPKVRFGADETGGIRVSHMSHIDGVVKVTLLKTKGKYETHAIAPLKTNDAPPSEPKPPFDWPTYTTEVEALIFDANDAEALEKQWEAMKPERLKARESDAKKAGELAVKVTAKIDELKA